VKPKLCVSFSGGRTSAFMARWIQLNRSSEFDIRYVFANTGQEHEKTLRFVNECDSRWGLGLEWIEAAVSDSPGVGTGYARTNFKLASRDGRPFEDVIRKYGIPNQAYPHCTRELKLQPIKSWASDVGFSDCLMAVGIRADEIDRMAPDYKKRGLVYPLISWVRMTKPAVIEWWKGQPFDLDLPENLGNCVWCWKKSLRKHLTTASESPGYYDFPERMEALYGLSGSNKDGTKRVFFRNHMTTKDIRGMAAQPFVPFKESHQYQVDWLDEAGACSESCEAFAEDS
jgi:hypothetical protein